MLGRFDIMLVVVVIVGDVIGIGFCIIYLARKIFHYGGGSGYGGGGIGIMCCIIYLARKI